MFSINNFSISTAVKPSTTGPTNKFGLIGSAVLTLIRHKQTNTKADQIYIYLYIYVDNSQINYKCYQRTRNLPKRKDLCYQKSKFKISVIKCLKVPTEYSDMNN